jgi:hypothetical protein
MAANPLPPSPPLTRLQRRQQRKHDLLLASGLLRGVSVEALGEIDHRVGPTLTRLNQARLMARSPAGQALMAGLDLWLGTLARRDGQCPGSGRQPFKLLRWARLGWRGWQLWRQYAMSSDSGRAAPPV